MVLGGTGGLRSPIHGTNFVAACMIVAEQQGLPLSACNASYNPSIPPQPKVQDTLAVCRELAPGFQLSSTPEWIVPFATWVLPAFGLLVVCPVAEHVGGRKKIPQADEQAGWWRRTEVWIWRLLMWLYSRSTVQWLCILGDPGSAFCGAFYEWLGDIRLCYFLDRSLPPEHRIVSRPEWAVVRWLLRRPGRIAAALFSKIPPFAEKPSDEQASPVLSEREQFLVATTVLIEQIEFEEPKLGKKPKHLRVGMEFLSGYRESAMNARVPIRGIFAGRIKINVGVVLPAVLYCGVAVTVIVDARDSNLGDNTTAHSLAFGTWYIWLLLLSVLGNCYVSHVSSESIQLSFEHLLRFIPLPTTTGLQLLTAFSEMQWAPLATNPFQTTRDLKLYTQKALGADKVQRLRNPYSYSRLRCRTTALRERYINCHYWHRWLHNQGIKGLPVHSALTEHNDKTSLTTQGWWWYLIYQFAGWMPIGLSCGCAAAISYTTPIAGLSCRSITHLLYGIGTLLACFIRPFIAPTHQHQRCNSMRYRIPRTLYICLQPLNIIILLGGTAFQLSGVYRNCQCTAGLLPSRWRGDTMVEFGVDTEEHRANAQIYWINVSYAAYISIGTYCATAVTGRNYMMEVLRALVEGGK